MSRSQTEASVSERSTADALSQNYALILVLFCVVAWGIAAWAFFPAQQASLIGIAGPKAAPIVLSLNASFMFIGFSLGPAIGSVIIPVATPANLGGIGALFEFAALLLVFAGHRAPASARQSKVVTEDITAVTTARCTSTAGTEAK